MRQDRFPTPGDDTMFAVDWRHSDYGGAKGD